MTTTQESLNLLPCPFCGGAAHLERDGTPRRSCIVECGFCGARLESSDEGVNSGLSWNRRDAGKQALAEPKQEPVNWPPKIVGYQSEQGGLFHHQEAAERSGRFGITYALIRLQDAAPVPEPALVAAARAVLEDWDDLDSKEWISTWKMDALRKALP